MFGNRRTLLLILISVLFAIPLLGSTQSEAANSAPIPLPRINFSIDQTTNPQELNTTLQIFFLLTILSLAPSFLILTTSFTRFVVVFAFLRQAMAIPQIPPNQILAGLALFLTFFVMAPTWKEINEQALQPYLVEEITQQQAFQNAVIPVRHFMFQQTRSSDLKLMAQLAKVEQMATRDDVPLRVLIPAFVVSELTTAFTIGFILFIPFLVIDMVVASILMSMGMMMLPPVTISLPFKILLFVLIDGWNLLTISMISGFQV